MKRPKSDYVIQTVTNALRLLEMFHDAEELGVTELSRRLDLHKNNVFRLLATLEQRHFVEQAPGSERYRLGVGVRELGQAFVRSRTLVRQARSVLCQLTEETGETVHIATLRDFEVVHLDGEQPAQLVLTGLRVGQRLPAHCTALGKVLLGCAHGSLRERYDRQVVQPGPLEARTPATIVDRDKLFEHLRAVASQGFALDLEECEVGLHCAGAPVHDGSGEVVAAVSVSGPAFRLGVDQLIRNVVPRVVAAAERISQQLG